MQKRQTLIGISQMAVSDDPGELLVAPNLGSCLGVAIYDHKTKIGGMIHCLLPASQNDPEKAKLNPCMYVDTGVVMLLKTLMDRGANKKDLVIKIAGCGNINDTNNVFEIGKKNHTVLKKVLWKNNLLLKSEHVGDSLSRTVILNIENGQVDLKINGEIFEL